MKNLFLRLRQVYLVDDITDKDGKVTGSTYALTFDISDEKRVNCGTVQLNNVSEEVASQYQTGPTFTYDLPQLLGKIEKKK